MTGASYDRIVAVFQEALDRPPAEQEAFVRAACADESAVRDRVLDMLERDRASGGGLTVSARGVAEHLLRDAFGAGECDPPSGDASSIPSSIGGYRIVRLLGNGGMGTVYEARQSFPDRTVALKTLREGLRSPVLVRRFEREIRLLARLDHPGIAQIHDAGTAETAHGRLPYFTMELIRGRPIAEVAEAEGLSTRERLALIADVCDAVQSAHQQGVIHRDLKPANILVTSDAEGSRRVKVLDFGIARAIDADDDAGTVQTDVGQLVGTLPYMSPEQVSEEGTPDTRTDVYSLGAVTYELLAGAVPLDVGSRPLHEAVRVIREQAPRRLSGVHRSLRGEIETIVSKAMEKDPTRRYASASELGADIRRYLNGEPIVARPATVIYQLRKFATRHKAIAGAVALATAALLTAVALSARWAVLADRAWTAESEASELAQRGESEMRWLAYRMGITAAQALLESDPIRAREQLDAVPTEHRRWEWRYLSDQLGTPLERVPATAARWRPDGSLLTARVDGLVLRVVAHPSGDVVSRVDLDAPTDRVELSEDGRYLRIHSPDSGRIRIRDLHHDRLVFDRSFAEFGGAVAFIPGTSSVAVHRREPGAIEIVDLQTGEVTGEFPVPDRATAEFRPGGTRVIVRSNGRTAELAVPSGSPIRPWSEDEAGRRGAWSADGTRRAEWGNDRAEIVILDAESGRERRTLAGDTSGVLWAAFSPTGQLLVSVGVGWTIRVWDVTSGEELQSRTFDNAGSVRFSPDESRLLFGGWSRSTVGVWSWRLPEGPTVLDGHGRYVYAIAESPDGSLVASGGWDRNVRLWDVASGAMLAALPVEGQHVSALGFTPDGSELLAACSKGYNRWNTLVSWTIRNGSIVDEPELVTEQGVGESATEDRVRWFWSRVMGDARAARFNGGEYQATSRDGRLLAAPGARSRSIEVHDLDTGTVLRTLQSMTAGINALAFSRDGRTLACGFADGMIRLWDVRSSERIAVLDGQSPTIYSLSFSPDGSRLASGGSDTEIRVWDLATTDLVGVLRGHTEYVHSVRFSADGERLFSGSGDGTVRIWTAESEAEPTDQGEARSGDVDLVPRGLPTG